MKNQLRLALKTSESQSARLIELQQAFAQVCNALSPLAQQTRCWNRVALHHMAYKSMRQQFPCIGSQIVCNAIYSVSRACRHVYQHPNSPFSLQRLSGRPLPQVHFLPQAPVYFDRHTLSLKDQQVSLFTLDGRMRFHLALTPADEQRFRNEKLREIVLTSNGGAFFLSFFFAKEDREDPEAELDKNGPDLPQYMLITDENEASSDHSLVYPSLAANAARTPS